MAKGTATFSPRAGQSRETVPASSESIDAPSGGLETREQLAVRSTATLNTHPGLMEARQKLRDLDAKRASLQAEFDQVQSSVSNPDVAALAERVLDGDDLSEVDAVVARRDSLRQKVAAYQQAMNMQQIEIDRQMREASRGVCDLLAPLHRAAADRLLNAFSEIQAAVTDLTSVKYAMDCSAARADGRFAYFELDQLNRSCHHFEHAVKTHWTPWMAQRDSQ